MRILVVGATGTIGKEIVRLLKPKHEVVEASRKTAAVRIEISDPASIKAALKQIGKVDAIVSASGEGKFAPLDKLSDADFDFTLKSKLMGQVNLVRYGLEYVRDNGSITLTSGVLAQKPMQGSAAISLINAGLEGFARAAALEAPRGIRVNVVSPPWVTETLRALKMDPSHGKPAAEVAQKFVEAIEGSARGAVLAV